MWQFGRHTADAHTDGSLFDFSMRSTSPHRGILGVAVASSRLVFLELELVGVVNPKSESAIRKKLTTEETKSSQF